MVIRYNTIGPDGLWGFIRELKIDLEDIISREFFESLQNSLNKRTVDIIIGPRQSGKTTLLYLLMIELSKLNVVEENIHYLNIDTLADYSVFDNPTRFYQMIRESHKNNNQKIYLILDEIQRLKNPGLFLKAIYDSYPEIKIITSGSSSLEIKAKTKEFLVGRKHEIFLLPFSFREIIKHSRKLPEELFRKELTSDNIKIWEEWEKIYGNFLSEQMMKIIIYGSYPGVFIVKDNRSKEELLYELYNSYVKKDITEFMKIGNISQFNNLVRVLAGQVGNMVNISEICSLIGGNRITIEKYINIMEGTYVIKLLPPLVGNKRNEIKYSKKCYFYDCGLRNMTLSQFEKDSHRSDFGSLLENMVAVEIIKSLDLLDDFYYWRTKSGAEVDFIINSKGEIIPIEVKFLSARVGTLSRSFYSFIDSFRPKKAVFLNRDRFGYIKKDNTDIFYIPVHWFVLRGYRIFHQLSDKGVKISR